MQLDVLSRAISWIARDAFQSLVHQGGDATKELVKLMVYADMFQSLVHQGGDATTAAEAIKKAGLDVSIPCSSGG